MPHSLGFPPASSTLPLSPSYRFSFYLPLLLSFVFPHCKICCVPEHLLIPLYVFLHIHSYSNFIHCYIFKYYFCVENFQICIFFLNLTYHIPHISISSLLDFHIQMLTRISESATEGFIKGKATSSLCPHEWWNGNKRKNIWNDCLYTQALGNVNRMKPLISPLLIVTYRLWHFLTFAIFSGTVL